MLLEFKGTYRLTKLRQKISPYRTLFSRKFFKISRGGKKLQEFYNNGLVAFICNNSCQLKWKLRPFINELREINYHLTQPLM